MNKALRAPLVLLVLTLVSGLELAGCQPSERMASAEYQIVLASPPTAGQAQQHVIVRARFVGLDAGPLDFVMPRRWAGYSGLSDQVCWLRVSGSEGPNLEPQDECIESDRDADERWNTPRTLATPARTSFAYWCVDVPQDGLVQLEYCIRLSGQDGAVPSKIWAQHALLLARSLFVFPANWLSCMRAPLQGAVSVSILPPKGWPVYASWPADPDGSTYLPDTLESLIDSAVALGHYHGFELHDPPFHARILLSPNVPEDRAEQRAADLGRDMLSVYRFFGLAPKLSADMRLLAIVVADDLDGAAGDGLSGNLVLVRSDTSLSAALDEAVRRGTIQLWNGGALRTAPRWSAEALTTQPWLALGWTDYLAWRIPYECDDISPTEYWDHLRPIARALGQDPAARTMSLAQAAEQLPDIPYLNEFVRTKGHLGALLLHEHLEAASNGERNLGTVLRRLCETHNYYTSGRLIGEKEVKRALADSAEGRPDEFYHELVYDIGPLDLSSIPHLSGPPVGEKRIVITPDDLNLVYQWIEGDSMRAAIYLNGGPGSVPYDWMYLAAKPLRPYLDVAYLEQRGSGRSSRPGSGAYSMDAYINDIEVVREQIGATRVVLIGHDWGGYCALAYAMRYPERIDALILMAPIPSYPRAVQSALREMLAQPDSGGSHVASPARQLFEDGVHTYDDLALATRLLAQAGAYGSDLNAVQASCERAYSHYVRIALLPKAVVLQNASILPTLVARDRLLQYDLMADLAPDSYPILILHGERDRMVPFSLIEALGEQIGGEVRRIARAGHYLYLENPAAVLGEIIVFLQNHPR